MLAWHIQKLLDKPKRFIQRCCPNRRGKKTTTKTSNQPCDQPDDTIPSMVQTASTSTHPKKRGEESQTNQTKNHWHTIEFSHNTRTPKHTPQTGPVQSSLLNLTHTHTTNQIAANADQVKGTINARFPTAISPQPVSIRLSGGALSVTLTHIKLHTPTQQHKSPGQVVKIVDKQTAKCGAHSRQDG